MILSHAMTQWAMLMLMVYAPRTLQAAFQGFFLHLLTSFLAASGLHYDGSDLLREALKLTPPLPAPSKHQQAGGTQEVRPVSNEGCQGGEVSE